jgi:pyridoxamine 5'-phosphate oxidase
VSLLPDPLPADPLPVVAAWLAEAQAEPTRLNPNALALATVDGDGRPSVRMVLLKALSEADGFGVFYTHYGSRKAQALAAHSRAAGVLYWSGLGRQVRFEGPVVRSPAAESDAYFATRPRGSRINAWVSQQSAPLTDPAELERSARRKDAELGGVDAAHVPRPPFWGGYRLWFDAVELWIEGVDRFHERARYRRTLTPLGDAGFAGGSWQHQRLQP